MIEIAFTFDAIYSEKAVSLVTGNFIFVYDDPVHFQVKFSLN